MRISDWSSDVCSSDLLRTGQLHEHRRAVDAHDHLTLVASIGRLAEVDGREGDLGTVVGGGHDLALGRPPLALLGVLFAVDEDRSEEHTSELQSLMRISYAVFCLKKKKHIVNEIKLTINVDE